MKTFRDLIPLGKGSPTERRVDLLMLLFLSCPWISASIMFLSAPDMRPNSVDKQISHSGRVRREGVVVQGRNMVEIL